MDGLIYASSMVMLDSARRKAPVPPLARWLLGLGIAATLAANVAHGLGDGLSGAVVAAWPAVALIGSYDQFKLADHTVSSRASVGYQYYLSKRTKVFTTVSHESKAASNKTGYDLGVLHSW